MSHRDQLSWRDRKKGPHDLIKAFKALECDCKLVIAGDVDHETNYSRNLRQVASEDDRIILTGYITGEPLNQVYTHARLLFSHPIIRDFPSSCLKP